MVSCQSTTSTTVVQTLQSTTASTITTTSDKCLACCSYNATVRQRNIMNNVDSVFSSRKQMDIVFVVKNSGAFLTSRLDQVNEFIRDLLTYLQQRGYVIVHPDYARIALFTFAENVSIIMNGIADTSGKYDACQLPDYVSGITLNQTLSDSDPLIALNTAKQTFQSDASRNATKILFHFDNGANWNQANGGAIATVVDDMKKMGVQRFAAGVGLPPYGWMNTSEVEQNVQSIASDVNNYYACMDDWSLAIYSALDKLQQNDDGANSAAGETNLYTYSPRGSPNCDMMNCSIRTGDRNCLACSSLSSSICACDAIARQFSCQGERNPNAKNMQYY